MGELFDLGKFANRKLESGEASYKTDPTYLSMVALWGSKNYRSLKNVFDLVIEEQPEIIPEHFLSKVDILGQVLDGNIEEEELGKRNYPPNLKDFTEKLIEEFCSIIFSEENLKNEK